jgi:hypothetical protein
MCINSVQSFKPWFLSWAQWWPCHCSYSGGWGRRITWVQEFKLGNIVRPHLKKWKQKNQSGLLNLNATNIWGNWGWAEWSNRGNTVKETIHFGIRGIYRVPSSLALLAPSSHGPTPYIFFFSPGVWTHGLYLGPLHKSFFYNGFFQDRVSWTICLGWLWTVILLISASWVAGITGESHRRPAPTPSLL